jgi:RNA polymerase sigma-70 factor (ECF subfamily)
MNFPAAARFLPLPLPNENTGSSSVAADRSIPVGAEIADEGLLTCIAKGDLEALGLLFQRYERIVRSIATRILRNSAEADDLVQDLFLFVQRKCSIFDSSKSSAGSWIVQMAYQRSIERRRYLTTRHFYTRAEIQSNASNVVGNPTVENDYSAEAVFGRNGLQKVLAALSEDQRETLRLHFFEGYTLAEISAKLGQPLGNVRHHYYRGLDGLRKHMFGRKVRGS